MGAYVDRLADLHGVQLLGGSPMEGVSYHLCVVSIDFEQVGVSRAEVMTALREQGIGTQVHYIPLYRHPVLQETEGEWEVNYPGSEQYYRQALSLPLYETLKLEDVDRVCAALKQVLSGTSVTA